MRVPYLEGLASHDGPESCAGARKGVGEALAGEHAGRVSSREKFTIQGADAVEKSGRQDGVVRHGKRRAGPAWSKTSRTHGRRLFGNREIPWTAAASASVRIGKGAPAIR